MMTMRLLILVSLIIWLTPAALAEPEDSVEFDTFPAPIGGMIALAKNIQYPDAARRKGLEGRVLVSVLITSSGAVENAKIIESVRKDLDQAAVNVIRSTKWKAAMKDAQPVPCEIVIPVRFKLDNKNNEQDEKK